MPKDKEKTDLDSLVKANEENRKNLEKLAGKVDNLESEIAELKSSKFESKRFKVNWRDISL